MRIRILATAALAAALVACSGGNTAGNSGGTTAGSTAGNGSTSGASTTGNTSGPGTTSGASTSGTTSSGTTTGGSTTAGTTTSGTTTSGTTTSGTTTSGTTTSGTSGTSGAGIGCSPGHYDLDGQSANGCEVTCDASGCHNGSGQTVPNPGFASGSQFSNFGAFSEGSNLSGPRAGASFRSVGRVGAPEVGPPMTGSAFKNQGGLLTQ